MEGNWFWAIATALIIPSLGFILKLLIDQWFEQKKEVEKYKAKRGGEILDDLGDELASLKTKIQMENQKSVEMMRALRSEIAEHKAMIMEQKGQISTVMKIFDSTLESARKISSEMDHRVDAKIQTEVRRIRDMILVRSKKSKGGKDGE